MPSCKINFLFVRGSEKDQGYFDLASDLDVLERYDHNLRLTRNNLSICKDILKNFLKQVKPYSIIYLNAHGSSKGCYSICQKVLIPGEKDLIETEIPIWFLSDVFSNFIPKDSQNNLQIKLLTCHGSNIAPTLLKRLNSVGFKKTSVVGYHDGLISSYEDGKLIDFSPENDRRGPNGSTQSGRLRQAGLEYKDNKLVSHNYSGVLVTEPYHKFKRNILNLSLSDFDNDVFRKELLIDMIISLEYQVNLYLNYFMPDNNGRSVKRYKHGSSGLNRAHHFLTFLSDHKKCIIDNIIFSKHPFIDDEVRLIFEFKNFCSKHALYAQFSGNINVDTHSCLTKVLNGLNEFYFKNNRFIDSNLLIQFGNYLNGTAGNREAPIGIYEKGNRLTHRKEVKRKIINMNIASMVMAKPNII